VERAVVLCRRPRIDVEDLPETVQATVQGNGQGVGSKQVFASASAPAADCIQENPMPLETALQGPEKRIIELALKRNNWNRQATAAELAINRTTLYKKMRKYQLDTGEIT